MKLTPIRRCYATNEEEVVGFDAEYADMSNPQGAIFRRVPRVVAETEDGQRFMHSHVFRTIENAEGASARIQEAGSIRIELWAELDPVYGSSAWRISEIVRNTDLRAAIARGDIAACDRLS